MITTVFIAALMAWNATCAVEGFLSDRQSPERRMAGFHAIVAAGLLSMLLGEGAL